MKYEIEIPETCSENWEKMTSTENGKYCATCQKEVVDFRNFSNSELAKYVHKNDKKCGRFLSSQLNREIILPKTKTAFPVKLFLGISSLLVNATLYAQELKSEIENTQNNEISKQKNSKEYIEISGVVLDEAGPLSGANIIEKNENTGTQTNVNGFFTIKIPTESFNKHVYLEITFIGMETQIIEVFRESNNLKIELKNGSETLGGYIVTGGYVAKKKSIFTRLQNLFRKKSTCH